MRSKVSPIRGEKSGRRIIMIFIISILTLSANGQMQIKPVKSLIINEDSVSLKTALQGKAVGIIFDTIPLSVIDTIPLVKYVKAENFERQPAFYINGKFMTNTALRTIDPMVIDSIHIEKNEIEIENKKYYGQIYITLKKEYMPKFISLNDLMLKYTTLKNEFTIYMIDNDIIKGNYDQCLVDEKYILKIIVDTIEIEKGKTKINVVRLLTKSKENIEKSREIRIRGLNEMILN